LGNQNAGQKKGGGERGKEPGGWERFLSAKMEYLCLKNRPQETKRKGGGGGRSALKKSHKKHGMDLASKNTKK